MNQMRPKQIDEGKVFDELGGLTEYEALTLVNRYRPRDVREYQDL